MKTRRRLKKSKARNLFKLSLVLSFFFVLALRYLPFSFFKKEAFEDLQSISELYLAFGLAALIIKKIQSFNKKEKVLAYLIFALLLAVLFLSFRGGLIPEILSIPLLFGFVICFFVIALPLLNVFLKIIFGLLRKHRRFIFSKKIFLPLSVVVLAVVLIVFIRNYNLLEKRVIKLEKIVGSKKLLCDEKESIERVKKSVVRIVGTMIEGSGFVIDSRGYIVTNYHVIAYDFSPKVILPDYSLVQGEVVMADKIADVAIVKIDQKKLPALKLGDSGQIEAMEELISVGYPLGTDLRGEASAIKGRFVARRTTDLEEREVSYLQVDISLNPGASGGPMIDVCGEVVGINQAGTAGLSVGIAVNYFKQIWGELASDPEPVKDVRKIEFNPNGSPKECVEAFYNYQTIGKLEEAYKLLSREYTSWTFEQWQEGYQTTLNIALYETRETEKNTVFVKFASTDLIDEQIVLRFFEGTWEVKKEGDNFRLQKAGIEEVLEPSWEWFMLSDEAP